MKRIDAEIAAVEERIAARKAALARHASAAKRRALKRVTSPAALVGAAAVGLLLVGIAWKRRPPPVTVERRRPVNERKKRFALGTLVMTGATWLIRTQFGGPVGLAQYVLDRTRPGRLPATAAPAELPPRVPR